MILIMILMTMAYINNNSSFYWLIESIVRPTATTYL